MSRSFRIFAPVQISEGVTEYKHIGDGIELEVEGRRVVSLSFSEEVGDREWISWYADEPPDFPAADSAIPSGAK